MPFFPTNANTWYPKYFEYESGEQLVCTDRNLCDYVATVVWEYHDSKGTWPKSLTQCDLLDLDPGSARNDLKRLLSLNLLRLQSIKGSTIVLKLREQKYIYPACGPDEKNSFVKVIG